MVVTYDKLDGTGAPRKEKRGHSCAGLMIVTFILFLVTGLSAFAVWKLCFQSGTFGVIVDDGALPQHYPPPPNFSDYAAVARYVMHISDWASLATISTHPDIPGYPFASSLSISDGALPNSTGIPYIYITDLDLSAMDIEKDPRVSLTACLVQSSYCRQQHLDPQNPACSRVILTGEVVKIANNTSEYADAQQALFSRHPEMITWPLDHGFFAARVDIKHIYVLDHIGGVKVVDPADYYAAQPFP